MRIVAWFIVLWTRGDKTIVVGRSNRHRQRCHHASAHVALLK